MTDVRTCPNCGTPAPGPFCPQCGQKQRTRSITLRHLLSDFFEDQFGIDNKALHTFNALLFHPGQLTEEFFAGRVQRYIAPFKLYLFASVIFFLMAGTLTYNGRAAQISRSINAAADSMQHAEQHGNKKVSVGFGGGFGKNFFGLRLTKIPTDNWLRDSEVNFGIAPLNRIARNRMQELARLGPDEGTNRLVGSLLNQIPRVMFVLLPISALLLFLFYFGKRPLFVEHFVFALHLQSFAFLGLSLTWLPIPFIGTVAPLWVLGYFVMAQHRFYRQRYLWVIAKSLVLFLLYSTLITCGVLASLALALTVG